MSEKLYYEEVSELVETTSILDANNLLQRGYIFLKHSEVDVLTEGRLQRVNCYILGRKKGATSKASEPSTPETGCFAPSYLDSLGWKDYANGNGAWVFASERDGSIKKDLQPLVTELEKSRQLDIGEYTYKLSKGDRGAIFLSRYHRR